MAVPVVQYPPAPVVDGACWYEKDGLRRVFSPSLHREAGPPYWTDRARIVLTPTAPPSVLGWFSYGAAAFVVGALYAGWFGRDFGSPPYLSPFVFFAGGLAQFLAAMWAYRARDTLATAIHGIWGAFWFAWGILFFFNGLGLLPFSSGVSPFLNEELAHWFIAMAVITGLLALCSLGANWVYFIVLGFQAAACVLAAIGFIHVSKGCINAAGWCFVGSAVFAWYSASAYLLEAVFGHTIIPVGRWDLASTIPGGKYTLPIEYPNGMPGSRVGQ